MGWFAAAAWDNVLYGVLTFGRPYDNVHKIIGCSAAGANLVVEFSGGERLTVTDPEGVEAGPDTFLIRKASRVRWEWFYYGRPQTPNNRYFFEYTADGSSVKAHTNVDWYTPSLSPSISAKAVEMYYAQVLPLAGDPAQHVIRQGPLSGADATC